MSTKKVIASWVNQQWNYVSSECVRKTYRHIGFSMSGDVQDTNEERTLLNDLNKFDEVVEIMNNLVM